MTIRSPDDRERDPKLVAAVMAAVEVYLADEARVMAAQTARGLGAWRMAARMPAGGAWLSGGLPWKGRG